MFAPGPRSLVFILTKKRHATLTYPQLIKNALKLNTHNDFAHF